MNIDLAKVRRESLRWLLILAMNNSRPIDTHESLLLTVAKSVYPDSTDVEIRRELDYLEERKITTVNRDPSGVWTAGLTALGIDIAEYTVDCREGIARPEKYWGNS